MDNWVLRVIPLIKLLPGNVNIDFDYLLNKMFTEEGLWNLDHFKIWLLNDVIRRIVGVPPLHPSEGTNKVVWCHTSIGAFSIKSAYRVLNEESWSANDDKWKCVWKLLGPQRIHFFIWNILKQILLSNVKRVRRGLVVDPSCPICG